MSIEVDTKDFITKSTAYVKRMSDYVAQAVDQIANEILRLSSFEVPHDTGMLQASGHVETQSDQSAIVGYNKVYAARLHEHPEYRFQKGRKGKYLEDPIKHNYRVFIEYVKDAVKRAGS
jgi:hypothetical protein